jgi:hypothetical protein
MLCSSLAKAALSAVFVGILLAVLRHATPRSAGLAAAVPINSMPALYWLSVDHGGAYAATAALGSLWGTGLTALLGLAFVYATRIGNLALAALLALLGVGALAAMIWESPAALTAITGLAMLAVLAGQAQQRASEGSARRRRGRAADVLFSMGVAGGMSLATSELSHHGGPQLCGLIATVPVIGLSTMVAGHREGGAPLMLRVLDGYLAGMLAKAAFLAALYCAWRAGSDGWAWAAAFATAGLALEAQRRLPQLWERSATS